MAEKEFHIGYEIKTLDKMIKKAVMDISMRSGIDQVTIMHGWIIAYLYHNQQREIYQKDLETEFHITRSTVTNILQLMEKKGYIERVSVEHDARLKKLILTEKAKKIQRQNFNDTHNKLEKQLTENISEEELKIFLNVVEKMKQNLENERGAAL